MEDLKIIGEELKRMRIKAGFSRPKFAEVAGITTVSIARIEAGQQNASPDTLNKLAAPLGCRVRLVIEPIID